MVSEGSVRQIWRARTQGRPWPVVSMVSVVRLLKNMWRRSHVQGTLLHQSEVINASATSGDSLLLKFTVIPAIISPSRWKSHSRVTVLTIHLPVWARKKFLKATHFKILLFLNTWRWCLPDCCQHARAHARALGMSTHAPDSGSHPSGWQSRQTDYLSPCSRQGKPSNSMLFSLKAAKTVSKHPPLLLTHTNLILHNSADPDPTVQILSLAVGSVRVITPTGDIHSCYVGFQSWDPPLLFSRFLLCCLPVPPLQQWSFSFNVVLTAMQKKTKGILPFHHAETMLVEKGFSGRTFAL